MSGEFWRVGHLYRDRAGVKYEDDEFLRWLNTTAGSIANSGGIRFKDPASGGPVDPETGRAVPAFFVLTTRDMSGQHHNPWDDVVDEVSGNIFYWGEAKRYKTAITPDQVSRLVARLGRGQFGLYFTTSWYSEQTQREIEADRYPVRLFSGLDIVNILRAGDCVSGGQLRASWKELALSEVEGHGADGLRPTSLW